MINLNTYIIEKLRIDKDIKINSKEDNEYVKIFYEFLKDHSFFDMDEDEYTYDLKENSVKLFLPEECEARNFVGACTKDLIKMLQDANIPYRTVSFSAKCDALIIHI